MAKPPGNCIFCGEKGLTKQHVWPAWLKKYNLPEDQTHIQITGESTNLKPHDIKTAVKKHQGHSGSRKFHRVCRTCNNGWIRRAEEAVKPLVLDLMKGKPVPLDASAQRRLAIWLCLLTIMSELTDPPTEAVKPDQRRWLRDKLEPPPGWVVYLARYTGTNWRNYICRHYGMQLEPSADHHGETHVCDTQASTFVIGQLCGHTLSSTVIPQADLGYAGGALFQVWPIGPDSQWGDRPGIGDAGVEALSSAFFRAIPPAD
jgi:hypothetical protein